MSTAVALFTRDLRVHDHPALDAAARAERAVPLFVLDDALLAGPFNRPNRTGFLLESLADLDTSLRGLGAPLVLRRGAWAETAVAVALDAGASAIHVSDDVSAFAQTRLERLEHLAGDAGIDVARHPGITVVPPGAVQPAGGGHFKVFTPFYRQWRAVAWRPVLPAPDALTPVTGIATDPLPALEATVRGERSPHVERGGETGARTRLEGWLDAGLDHYEARHDDLPGDATSRISAALHFGCLSPLEVATRAIARPAGEPFVRQLCWRDFYHQVLAARSDASHADYKHRGDHWVHDDDALAAWKAGRTGYPVVDAGMRQLLAEGFMHNRARMVVASFLTKDLSIDWREGAAHFLEWLVDGDVANNNLNWQWTAGTGTDTNPHRIFNPTLQGQRFDPDGDYVRRYVPELAGIPGRAVHEPGPMERAAAGYPEPIVDHHAAIAEYRARRA